MSVNAQNPKADGGPSTGLRDSTGFGQNVLDALTDHICVLSENGIILAVNRAWREFAAANSLLTRNAGIGADYYAICDAVTGEDTATAREALRGLRAVERRELPEFALEYACHSPEEQRWFELRATRLMTNGTGSVVVSHRNVTQRKEAELTLRDSEERYHSLVTSSLDAVLLTVPDGRVLSANAAACAMFGCSEQDLIRIGRSGVVDRSDPRLAPALTERDRTGKFCGELTFVRQDGTTFPGEISSSIFIDSHGERRTSMVIRDITERKRVEAELAAYREALRALTARMDREREETGTRIAREIHDELGRAMTDLKLDLAWLVRRLAETGITGRSAIRKRIARMSRQVESYAQTVRRIATELRPAVLDALGLPAAIEWQARDFQQRTGVPCRVVIPQPPPALKAEHATALFRVFQEILNNIIQHAHATQVEVRLMEMGGVFMLEVRDNGRGITLAEQSDPAALGMLGMRERVEAMGSTLQVEGVAGKGTTITMSIPVSAA